MILLINYIFGENVLWKPFKPGWSVPSIQVFIVKIDKPEKMKLPISARYSRRQHCTSLKISIMRRMFAAWHQTLPLLHNNQILKKFNEKHHILQHELRVMEMNAISAMHWAEAIHLSAHSYRFRSWNHNFLSKKKGWNINNSRLDVEVTKDLLFNITIGKCCKTMYRFRGFTQFKVVNGGIDIRKVGKETELFAFPKVWGDSWTSTHSA